MKGKLLMVLAVSVVAGGAVRAHHSFAAEFDANKPVTISGKDFLLPVSAQVSLTSKQDHITVLNSITFHKYSKFETDVKIVE